MQVSKSDDHLAVNLFASEAVTAINNIKII